MYVITLERKSGKLTGKLYIPSTEDDTKIKELGNDVIIPAAFQNTLNENQHLILSYNTKWSEKSKKWAIDKSPMVVDYPVMENSDIATMINASTLTEEEKNKYIQKSMLSSIKERGSVSIEKDKYYVSNEVWNLLSRNLTVKKGRNNKNTLLTGPSGCGKTSLIQVACKKLGIPFSKFDMGACNGDATSTLLGVHRIVDGKSVFDYSDFVYKIQQPGVILLDEINRADYSAMNILLPVLDDSRTLKVDVAGSGEKRSIPVNPDCIFVATANIGSEYTGTNEMDSALSNRFFTIEIDDMPGTEEAKVLSTKCGISEDIARKIVKVAESLRDNYKKGKISYKVSIRETTEVADLISDGYDLKSALRCVFLSKFRGTPTEGEKSIVYQTIESY